MNQNLSVHLRWYRGKEMSYNADGSPKTENNIVKLQYDTQEYWRFLEHLRYNGCCKAVVEQVLDFTADKKGAKVEDVSKFQADVDKALFAEQEKSLTPDQKRIAELEAKIDMLMSAKSGKQSEPAAGDDLAALREEYTALAGKQGDKRWTVDTLREKIEELKSGN